VPITYWSPPEGAPPPRSQRYWIAPQANIILFEANTSNDPDMFQAVATAAAYPGVSAVSMSWGEGEFSGQTADDSSLLTPSGHQGVTFLASTGDTGTPAGYPSFSPNVVAVGGTSLTIQTNGTYVSETPWSNGSGADGGGISTVESQPTYQTGKVNGASSTFRTVPDVSMDADPYTGVYVLDTYSGSWFQVGGTSLSSPLAMGSWARIECAHSKKLGFAGPLIYQLANGGPTPSSPYFNDVILGGNGLFTALPGYDYVTGLGSWDISVINKKIPSTYPQ